MRRAWKERLPEWLTAGAALVYYWIMALYKLTQAPIWQDEAMEFYCSLPDQGRDDICHHVRAHGADSAAATFVQLADVPVAASGRG